MFQNHWKIKSSSNFYQNLNITDVQMLRQILITRLL